MEIQIFAPRFNSYTTAKIQSTYRTSEFSTHHNTMLTKSKKTLRFKPQAKRGFFLGFLGSQKSFIIRTAEGTIVHKDRTHVYFQEQITLRELRNQNRMHTRSRRKESPPDIEQEQLSDSDPTHWIRYQ